MAHVAGLYPDLKVVFLMRHPVDRTWSWLKYSAKRSGNLDTQDVGAIIKRIRTNQGTTMRNDYLGTMDRWERHFPREQLFYDFYDSIKTRPKELLAELCGFLGVELVAMGNPERVRNPSTPESLPPAVETYLFEQYGPLIRELDARVGGAASQWHQDLVRRGYGATGTSQAAAGPA